MEQQRGLLRRFFVSKSFLLVGLVVLLLLGFAFGRAYYQNYKLKQEIQSMLDQAANYKATNGDLKSLLSKVHSEDYVKGMARNMNLVQPGENVTVIVGGQKAGSGQLDNAVVESKNNSNLKLWWNYFFNH
jgi:cell division protein FtsL